MARLGMRQFRGDRLREARETVGYSQSQLGLRIGAHVTSVSDWERNKNSPSGRYVAALCVELDVTPEYLYGEDDDEEEAAASLPLTREQTDLLGTLAVALEPFKRQRERDCA